MKKEVEQILDAINDFCCKELRLKENDIDTWINEHIKDRGQLTIGHTLKEKIRSFLKICHDEGNMNDFLKSRIMNNEIDMSDRLALAQFLKQYKQEIRKETKTGLLKQLIEDEDETILIIGTDALTYKDNKEKVFIDGLAKYFADNLNEKGIHNYDSNIFKLGQKISNVSTQNAEHKIALDFYKKHMDDLLIPNHEKITKIKFKKIINLNYDTFLSKKYPNMFEQCYVVLKGSSCLIKGNIYATDKTPIINIFGCLDPEIERSSCFGAILNETDLITFIRRYSDSSANSQLKEAFTASSSFFLHKVNFEHWFTRYFFSIVFKESNYKKEKNTKYKYHNVATYSKVKGFTREFFEDNFNTYFASDLEEESIIDSLLEE